MALEPSAPQQQQQQQQQHQQQPPVMQQPHPAALYPGPVVTSGQLGNNMQHPFQVSNLPNISLGQVGMPPIPTTSGQNGIHYSGSPNQNGSGASDISFDEEAFPADQPQTTGRRTNAKLQTRDTKTKRNPKQQMQNKQAQQRYRCLSTPILQVACLSYTMPALSVMCCLAQMQTLQLAVTVVRSSVNKQDASWNACICMRVFECT